MRARRPGILVVISCWLDRGIDDLLALAGQLRRSPDAPRYDLLAVVNGDADTLPAALRDFPGDVLLRPNIGYNLGAWDAGWRARPGYGHYLFLQDECRLLREGWAREWPRRCRGETGVLGESLSVDWDRPWPELHAIGPPGDKPEHCLDGRPVDRATFYLACLARWGIPAGPTARHLQTLVLFAAAEVLEAVDGFRCGRGYGEAIAAEIGFSRAVEAAGWRIEQAGRRRFEWFEHPQWSHLRGRPAAGLPTRPLGLLQRWREPGRGRGLHDRLRGARVGWLLCDDARAGSSRLNGPGLHHWLNAQGLHSRVLQSSPCFEERLTLSHAEQHWVLAQRFDVVAFQRVRQGEAAEFAQRLRAAGTRTLFIAADLHDCALAHEADAVVASSDALRRHWLARGVAPGRLSVLPEAIGTPRALVKDHHQPVHHSPRLAWFGAAGHWPTALRLRRLLVETPALGGCELVSISNHPEASVPWALDTVWRELAACDIGVIPLDPGDPASRAESNHRVSALQALGLPVVCGRLSAWEATVVDGVSGFFADGDAEWVEALRALRDPALRRRVGLKGHALAWSEYAPAVVGARLLGILDRLLHAAPGRPAGDLPRLVGATVPPNPA